MREISLLPDFTGTNGCITLRNTLRVSSKPPLDSYLVGSHEIKATSLEDIAEAFDVELPQLISPEFQAIYKTFLCGEKVDWSKALGSRKFAQTVKTYRENIIPLVEKIEETGYVETLIKGREIFENLQPIKVNKVKVRSLIEAGEHLESFLPTNEEYCKPVVYSHGSRTGRLTVKSGPRVLTLPKEHRGILRSRYPGGKIHIIDFACLEPRLALYAVGKTAELDIYGEIAKMTGESRALTKIAILSFIYGAASNDSNSQLKRFVRRHFCINELQRLIIDDNGKNGFGRPLHVEEERLLIPHWVQSTAVDVCLLGFSNLVKEISHLIDPLFMVHDALFIDAPPENLRLISGIISNGLMVSPYGHFPVSLKSIDESE